MTQFEISTLALGTEAEKQHGNVTAALKEELVKHVTEEGAVMNSSSWVISGRTPG